MGNCHSMTHKKNEEKKERKNNVSAAKPMKNKFST